MMPSVRASTDVGKDELPPFWEDPDFEGKSLPGKLYSAYVGQKGLLWWLNETAWYGSFALAFIWVCIRFVGPALGLWQVRALSLSPLPPALSLSHARALVRARARSRLARSPLRGRHPRSCAFVPAGEPSVSPRTGAHPPRSSVPRADARAPGAPARRRRRGRLGRR